MDSALAALAAAVSAVESATDAAAAAASAAAAGFAAEMNETDMHPLEYGVGNHHEAGYDEAEERPGEPTVGKDELHLEASAEPNEGQPGTEGTAPSYQPSKHDGNPDNVGARDGHGDVHVRHMHYDQPRWHDMKYGQDHSGHFMNDSYDMKAPLQAPNPSPDNPSPKRVTRIHTPLDIEPPEIPGIENENMHPEMGRRVSSRTKSKMNNLIRLGRERSRLFELGVPDSEPQRESAPEAGSEQVMEIEEAILPLLTPAKVPSTARNAVEIDDAILPLLPPVKFPCSPPPDGTHGDEHADEEAKGEEEETGLDGHDLRGKRKRDGKATSGPSSTKNGYDENENNNEGKLSGLETPCRPRAAKLVAQRLCAPRKRHRAEAFRAKVKLCNDEQDDEDDEDFETNENDEETDDEDDEAGGEDLDEDVSHKSNKKNGKGGKKAAPSAAAAEHPLVVAHGTAKTAITKVPEDMSGWKLVPGMLIRASILEEFMIQHAQQNRNEVLVAILALQTSQYWSYRCHCHGTAPKPADGRVRSKSKKCKCGWRLCFRVVNEKETLDAKSKASHPDNRRPAQIAVALLQVNSVHEEHTGHVPEPYVRGMAVKFSKNAQE